MKSLATELVVKFGEPEKVTVVPQVRVRSLDANLGPDSVPLRDACARSGAKRLTGGMCSFPGAHVSA